MGDSWFQQPVSKQTEGSEPWGTSIETGSAVATTLARCPLWYR